MNFHVHEDIRKAETLPASFYKSDAVFEAIRKKIFEKTWLMIGSGGPMGNADIQPIDLAEGFVKEPLLLTRDKSENLRCLSNVCTHRANLLMQSPKNGSTIICGYHGRKFGIDGSYLSMPEFETTENFPRPCDDLKQYPVRSSLGFNFTSLDPQIDFDGMFGPMEERVGFLPVDQFQFRPELSKSYLVNAHWALYCDNYLEGFHIPFVHHDLNAVLDYKSYETVQFPHGNLQVGYSKGGEEIFDLPKDHMDYGKQIAAYYFWLFPNMMFNFYSWGLSLNLVNPITPNKTKVNFLTYVYDESKLERGAGALLDKVEREDEFVVEGVQKGLMSESYTTGRFSPTREQGVHQFHRLLAGFLGS